MTSVRSRATQRPIEATYSDRAQLAAHRPRSCAIGQLLVGQDYLSIRQAIDHSTTVIGAIAPVLLETPQTARIRDVTKERKKSGKNRGTGKGQQWRIDAARKGAETRRQQKEATAARSGETLKSRPRSKDARLQPVIALLREKAAEGRSHAMTDLERECRMRSIDAGLIDEAVRHLGRAPEPQRRQRPPCRAAGREPVSWGLKGEDI